jgi:hypothetical protein
MPSRPQPVFLIQINNSAARFILPRMGKKAKSRRARAREDDLVRPQEAARVLGVTVGTLDLWRNTGRRNVPFIGGGGRGKPVWYRRSDLFKTKAELGKRDRG